MNFEVKLKWSSLRISCKFFRNRVSLHQGKVGMESTNEQTLKNSNEQKPNPRSTLPFDLGK